MKRDGGGSRLNPLALPPATTGRFLLLVATGLAASVQVYGWLVARLATVSAAPAYCVEAARRITGSVRPEDLIDWYSGCEVWANVREAGFVLWMIGVFVAVTVVIYLAMPWWARRSMMPLRLYAASPALAATVDWIEDVVAEEAPGRAVSVYVASGSGGDRAFGRIGRYAIALTSSRLTAAARDPGDPALRSVLKHELAHLRNRDIDLTYLTIAVWWGFLGAVVALPLVYVAFPAPEALAGLSWRLGVLLLLFWLLRASVLRVREHYADVTSDGGEDLERTLYDSPGPYTGSRLRGWFRFHPYTLIRILVLRDPDRLYKLEPGVAAAVGALIGLGYPPAHYLADLLLPDRTYLPDWLCGLLFGTIAASVLAGSVWRAALWAATGPERKVRTLPSALAFTGALMGGLLLTPDLPEVSSFWSVASSSPWIAVAVTLSLLVLAQVFLRWTLFCATARLPVAARPRWAYRFGVLQAALVLGLWLSAWFRIHGMLLDTGMPGLTLLVVMAAAMFDPLIAISTLWAFWYPLATWRGRRRRGRYPLWRDPADETPLPGIRTPLGPVYLAAAAILVAYAVVMIPFRSQTGALMDERAGDLTRSASEYLPILLILVVPALIITAAGLFLLGVVTGGRGRLERSMIAAGAVALPAAAGLLVLMLFHLGAASPLGRTAVTIFLGLLKGGGPIQVDNSPVTADRPAYAALGLMILGLFTLLLVVGLPSAALGSLVRSLRPAAPPRRPAGRPAWLAALLILPVLLLGGGIAWRGVSDWQVPDTVTLPQSIDLGHVEQLLAEPWPDGLPLDQSCLLMIRNAVGYLEVNPSSPSGGFDLVLARAGGGARTSADPTLRAMGEGTIEFVRRKELRRAQQGVTAALRYCATASAGL
jgi:Zn-dependent protease with chaperone function